MMINVRWAGILFVMMAVAAACVDPKAENCRVVEHSTSDPYDLAYRLLLPEGCPVDIGGVGVTLFASGEIVDKGEKNMFDASIELSSENGKYLNGSVTEFRVDAGRWVARPGVDYQAATGASSNTDINQTFDRGTFTAYPLFGGSPLYGTVDITYSYNEYKLANVSGSRIPLGNTTGSWSVSASGGLPPYQYRWYRDGTLVSSGSSYSVNVGTADFDLRAEGTDASGLTLSTVARIDVDGVQVSVDGPSLVYTSQGTQTWAAVPEGGYTPYSFTWYVNDQYVGTGPSYEAALSKGSYKLRVDMADSRGAKHGATYFISVIDDSCTDGICGAR